ncbi:MAG: aminotransferase class I/II-fold pyridoxal phosphate-dependent enzyme [Gammaproteobacteria bacterium]|nr:aminotransferase class I/II-fold pyridoxal phosphate-dependent enzyme [Gammaproteobacteria bacterium]
MINKRELELLGNALAKLEEGTAELPDFTPSFDAERASEVLMEAAGRMQDNYPYYHPQYAGQMLKPPHPVARMAYAMSLWINPNNHALDGGRASSAMEKECIVELGRMFGWEQPLGHLAGGGTMANLEALWVAGRLDPGKKVIASQQAHYTHSRISEVLGIPFTSAPVDVGGRMDVAAVERLLAEGDVGTVVVTIGNTGLGSVDPLADILALRDRYDFRIHADAAYGGYFGLAAELDAETRRHYDVLSEVDSIVIDPHKHGLQPYGCGCILFRDPAVGTLYKHDSPYTYFSSGDMHLGEITLECSRPGASAVALWATHRLLPPVPDGEFAQGLNSCLRAARTLWRDLHNSSAFTPLMPPELDIVVYAVNAETTSAASKRAREVFDAAAKRELHLALIELPVELFSTYAPNIAVESDSVVCLRSVLMKPEHEEWVERLTALLEASAE